VDLLAQFGAVIGLEGLGQLGNPGAVDFGQAGVQAHRGEVMVRSSAEGTCFTVTPPLRQRPSQ